MNVWGPAEWVVAVVLLLAGAWILSKVLGVIWAVIGGPVVRVWDRYVEWRESTNYGSPPLDSGSRTSSPTLVRSPLNQIEPEPVRSADEVVAYLSKHNVADEDAVSILAVMRRSNGDHFLSANKILDTVGGTASDVKAQVASLRPKPPAPKPSARLDRPRNGW